MSGRHPNDDIGELKEKLGRHETKIAELEQQLQQVRDCATEKIKELEYEKKALENEVSDLKKRIKWLEDEVRYFSTKPVITDLKRELQEKDARMNSMENKLNAIINQMDMMKKKSQDQEKELEDCREEIHCFSKKSQDQEKEMKDQGKDLKDCREDLKYFTKKSQDQEKKLNTYIDKTDELEKSRNMLYIGQLCAKVMEAIYRIVLPVYFKDDDYTQPHLRVIDRKIEELYHTSTDKLEAQRKWKRLQDEKIDAELVDFMEDMLAERNDVGHPSPLYEEELKNIASNLPGQKQRLFEKVIQVAKDYSALVF